MDIDLLRTFVAIAETRSFTAAARRVGRTQSAVSLQMRRLEDFLGRPLLIRGTNGVSPTEHGALLLEHARDILTRIRATEALFERGEVEGVVVLGMPDDYAPRVLARILGGFTELYPAATIDLVIDESRTLVRRLADGSVDLALITEGEGPVTGGPIAFRDRIVWVAPRSTDLHLRDPLPLAIWDESDGYARRMLPALKAMGRAHRIAIRSRHMTGLRGAVAAGIAVTAMMESGVVEGMRILGEQDGFPPLAELAVRLEQAHLKRSPVIERLRSHLIVSFEQEGSGEASAG